MFCLYVISVLQIRTGHKSQSEVLLDYCDGEVFQSHPLFSMHTKIMSYFNELEVANPLGSKAKIYKLGTVYMLSSTVRGYRDSFCVQGCST